MAISEESIKALRDSIRDGSFPDSNELLTAELTTDTIPALLSAISEGRDELKNEIRDVSKGQAGDVDEWIAQATKVQDDIAKCKIEARQIVEEHERVEAMRKSVRGASNKVQLLEAEIAFTRSLEHEMQNIGEIAQVLDEAGNHLLSKDPVRAVEKLGSIKTAITSLSVGLPRDLLLQLEDDLCQKSRTQIREALDSRWVVRREEQHASLEIVSDASIPADDQGSVNSETCRLLDALEQLDALPDSTALISRRLEAFILPLLSSKSLKSPSSVEAEQNRLTIMLASTDSVVDTMLDVVKAFIKFLNDHLPSLVREDTARHLLPRVISLLISSQLNSAVPYDLDELRELEHLRDRVSDLATLLSQYSWPGSEELSSWVEDIPQIWLAQRQMKSLDVVRKSFAIAKGDTRQVERIERQTVSKQEAAEVTGQEVNDDWNAAWDDEPHAAHSHDMKADEEEDASGWDLEIEDDQPPSNQKDRNEDEEIDDAEAWGWGDESPQDVKKETPSKKTQLANGQPARPPSHQEMILTELYTITDIPDHILEIIGRDMTDNQTLRQNPQTYFKSHHSNTNLESSPPSILAMFRATAPTHYSHHPSLSNMHLYNDTLYLIQKLSETTTTTSSNTTLLQSALTITNKFARQTYTRELDIQRTILSDLLDGAQGFESCTTPPYSHECTNAIASVTQRIRQLHSTWTPILSQSHTLQSLGTLIAMTMQKLIRDVEDMDDITEPQGQRLIQFCQDISSLDSLFTSPSSSSLSSSNDEHAISTIPLYVPNYFRFQYLTQILESNLVEINYLWKESEMHLEFSVEEVVDLIRALFAESGKRRDAIAEIRRVDVERRR